MLDELVQIFELADLLQTPLRQLSLGQRMKCEIAASLLHDPKILFLDEPSIGLDSTSKIRLRRHIRERNAQTGTTIILTTHDMDDIESVCSRVIVIGRGSILYDGSLDLLRKKYAPERRMIVTVSDRLPIAVPAARIVRSEGDTIELLFDNDQVTAPELISSINDLCAVRDLTVESPDIDEVVSRMYDLEAI